MTPNRIAYDNRPWAQNPSGHLFHAQKQQPTGPGDRQKGINCLTQCPKMAQSIEQIWLLASGGIKTVKQSRIYHE